MKTTKFIFFLSILFSISCQQKKNDVSNIKSEEFITDSIYYAQGFALEIHRNFKLVKLKNPWKKEQILQTYILCPKSQPIPENLPEGILIRTPLEKTVAFSSVICGFFEELEVLSTLTGVAESQFINIPFINNGIKEGTIQDIGQAANPDIEKLLLIEPEALFTNPISDSGVSSLNKSDVPVIRCFEYMETNPLGQAEWIRFYGWLFEKEELADSLFFQTVNNYNQLKESVKNVDYHPTVFTELKYGDFWYMPGGESYMANLFSDAGADYILKDDDNSGSIPLNFETVLDKAEDADFWLFKYYSPYEMTYKQLKTDYSNYSLFKAFKNQKIYVCNTMTTGNYYTELPLHPDWILRDFISIFHPELLPENECRYYRQLTLFN